jgi:hypothetical protein
MAAEDGGRSRSRLQKDRPDRRILEAERLDQPDQGMPASKLMGSMRQLHKVLIVSLLALPTVSLFPGAHAQQLAKRLILKDGSYQLASKWEVKGDRVRYLSAERNEWEELPESLVDWRATDKYEKDRAAGVPSPEAAEIDKEVEAERKADEAKTPQVAPGLRLPEDGGTYLLDNFQTQPQLVVLQQNNGEINANRTGNILRAAINPISSSKRTVELEGSHASVQAHATVPAFYISLDQDQTSSTGPQQPAQPQQPEMPWDRFHIVRAQSKRGKRIVGDIKISPLGKASQEQNMVLTTSQRLNGGWVKITPASALEPGEYALVEMLGKDGMNTYVWDFGVNPSAPANQLTITPDPSATAHPAKPADTKSQRP